MSSTLQSQPFDVYGRLPTGVTVLEASAGTGKTYAIAALAARYVADGVPLDQMLLVTFTRMATGELRERVRHRLEQAEQGLEHVKNGGDPPDELVALLAERDLDVRRERLARALADFDAATVDTTHAFCQQMLDGLGVDGDTERDATFIEDPTDLVTEVVDDLYVRRFANDKNAPAFDRAQAMRIAQAAVDNPVARIEPQGDGAEVPAMRRRFAEAVRKQLDIRKRRQAVLTYDDLLIRLRDALRSGNAVAKLRRRYRVVLVDEFQDTDPVQWEILQTAFGHGDAALVLIGDPKQAIYAFRGADVHAYLKAARSAEASATLATNHRSDAALLRAFDALFDGAPLGHRDIVYRQVDAEHAERRLHDAGAPLRIRHVARDAVEQTPSGLARKPAAVAHIAEDCASDIVRLLRSDATIDGRSVRAGDIAVLVRKNAQAAQIRDALALVDVPAVINGAGSVFETTPADEWLRLLEALERPSSPPRARSVALTAFVGWDAERVAGASDEDWEVLHRRLHGWARVLRERGVAALLETITLVEGLPERLLGRDDGERTLTDQRHVAQLLHEAAVEEQLGVTALASWLRHRMDEAARDAGHEERSRRLESDAAAVQVLTVHRSKGLEFPIVHVPFLWEPPRGIDDGEPVVFHDADADDARVVDVGLAGGDYALHKRLAEQEDAGEDLRLAYVALTRARHQVVLWWVGAWKANEGPLTRLLYGQADQRRVPTDDQVREQLALVASRAPGCIAIESSKLGPWVRWDGDETPVGELAAAVFDRVLDHGWRRTSYSDMTAAAHDAWVASEPEEPVVADEPEAVEPSLAGESAFAQMPVGARIGTLVHKVFEEIDFTEPVDPAVLPDELGDVAGALQGVLDAQLPAGWRLSQLSRADRLDELTFELPLAGGERPVGEVTPKAIGALLREHLPASDPLAPYADRLDDPSLRRAVRGYLTGSIDLVARVGGRYVIADYKTNWLAGPDEPLTLWHHRPEALAEEMRRAHYGLQALLYTVALHRYLRWRLPSYSPGEHLGGVLYLFIRGMPGAGVFSWHPPAALVEALSDLLETG